GGRLRRECCRCRSRNQNINPQTNQFGSKRSESVVVAVRPAIFDHYVLRFDISGIFQASAERTQSVGKEFWGIAAEKSDYRHRRLLRSRRKRPHRASPAEKRDELAPSHSITSSASCWRCTGTSRPKALAAVRLIVSSNVVGRCTGRSAGFSPLRMRST